jgi:hypothetical protein
MASLVLIEDVEFAPGEWNVVARWDTPWRRSDSPERQKILGVRHYDWLRKRVLTGPGGPDAVLYSLS